MVAILIGLIFLGQQLTQVGVMNINGAIFLFLTNMTFQNVFATINVSLRIKPGQKKGKKLISFKYFHKGLHLRTACLYEGGPESPLSL